MKPSWKAKFAVAFRGIWLALRGERSFAVHGSMTLAVLMAAAWLRLQPWEWGLLWLCIGLVWTCELFNTSIERLARAVSRGEQGERKQDADIGAALDIASGGVLCMALTAALLGAAIFGHAAWMRWLS
jgi:diacylglycerol kinase (ATP)